jgi:hypothetical protein
MPVGVLIRVRPTFLVSLFGALIYSYVGAVLSSFLRFPFLRSEAQKWKSETIKYHWGYEMSIASERAPGIKNRVVMLLESDLSHQPGQRGIAGQHEA